MPKITKTILMAFAATAAVLTIAACGSSNHGWSTSDVNKLKSKFNAEIAQTKSALPAKDQGKFQSYANTFLNCTLNIVEPVATPTQALSTNWKPSTTVTNKIVNQCEKPFQNSVESLAKAG